MKIINNSQQSPTQAPSDYFTGDVKVDGLLNAPEPVGLTVLNVNFEAGARTAWHTHPLGQLLFVISGEGWAQSKGQAKQAIHAGDTVWFEPGEVHWHGATDTSPMMHIAMQQSQNGTAVQWMEHVDDEDYLSEI